MKALIIGYGSIGKRHHSVLLELYPKAKIHLVSSRPQDGEIVFPDLKSVEDISAYDYYIISSQTSRHFDDLSFLNEKISCKKILLEKPVFDRVRHIGNADNFIRIGYNLRFHSILKVLRTELSTRTVLTAGIQTGQYLPSWRPGTDYRNSYSSSCERGGGVLLDLSHELDYAQWLFGKCIELHAVNRKVSSLEIDSDDIMSMIAVTDRNVIVTISIDYLSRITIRRLIIQCQDSTIFADLIACRIDIAMDESQCSQIAEVLPDRNDTYRKMHREILEGSGCDACTLDEGLSVMTIVEKIRKSERKDWNHV